MSRSPYDPAPSNETKTCPLCTARYCYDSHHLCRPLAEKQLRSIVGAFGEKGSADLLKEVIAKIYEDIRIAEERADKADRERKEHALKQARADVIRLEKELG